MMYRAGVQLEKIARIFGHSDSRTTAHYSGLDIKDMSAHMEIQCRWEFARFTENSKK